MISLRGPLEAATGYGQHVLYTAQCLKEAGYAVGIEPSRTSPQAIAAHSELVVAKAGTPHLLIETPDCTIPSDYWFTMHETTRLAWDAFQRVSTARHLIVPCSWNAVCFNAQGVPAQLHICPLGINHSVFYPGAPKRSGPFVFGVFGTPSQSNAVRKNFAHAVRAFHAAFDRRAGVELQIKQLPTCSTVGYNLPNVSVIADVFTEVQIADWLRNIDVLILPSRCEAFGFTALQAMACGKPVIGCAFGGPADYLTDLNAYLVQYALIPVRGTHMETGLWAEPSLDSTVAAMQAAYNNRDEVVRKGVEAVKTAAHYSWSAYATKLQTILRSTGFFENCKQPVYRPSFRISSPRVGVDDLVNFYADHPGSSKPKLDMRFEPEKYTLTNTPTGMGDSVMLTDLPRAAAQVQRVGTSYLSSPHFRDLIQFNPFYTDAHHPVWVSLSSLQQRFDLGPGHNLQKARRAFGLPVDPRPAGCIVVPGVRPSNRVSLHFEAGVHAASQRQMYHPRAREIYPENLAVIREFIRAHPELDFFEVGGRVLSDTVPSLVHLPLPAVVCEMAACCLHIGIISGPYHVANALGVRTIVIINFPSPNDFMLPCLKNVDVVESEWLYPQSHVLHQDQDSPHWPKFSLRTLEMAYNGETYPYADPSPFLSLVCS